MTTQPLDDSRIAVVCAADDNYAMPLAVTLRSALEHLAPNWRLSVFIIDGGLQPSNQLRLRKSLPPQKCDIHWLPPPDALLGDIQVLTDFTVENIPLVGTVSATQHLSIATYYRLLIADLLPKEINKVIYLDSDLVVLKDLGQLWTLDLQEAYLLAAHALLTPYVSSPGALVNFQALGLPPDAKYFQPGVMLINLDKWRADQISTLCLQYLKTHRDCIRWHDSDVLNAVLAGKWGELDPRWNQTPDIYLFPAWQASPLSEQSFNQLLHDPYIVHFASRKKPWRSERALPLEDLWFRYLAMTAWSGRRWLRWGRGWRRVSRKLGQFQTKVASLI